MRSVRLLLVAVILAGLVLPSGAKAVGLSYGAKAGLIMSKASVPDDSYLFGGTDITFRKGMVGGVFVNVGVTPFFSVQPEFLFAMKGTGAELTYEGYNAEMTLKMNYLVVPVLARVSPPMGGIVKTVFYAGPSMGFMVSDSGELTVTVPGVGSATADIDFSDAVKKNEFSLVSGIGLDLDLPVGTLSFDMRYEYGMTKVVKGGEIVLSASGMEETEVVPEDDTTFWSLAFTVGYAF